jgi:hypothetical protein
VSTHQKRTAEVVSTTTLADRAGPNPTDQSRAFAKKRTPGAGHKKGHASAGSKASTQTPRTEGKGQKLLCRYCGSNDLAPSFKKRGDARCRACFKQRYGKASSQRKSARTQKRQVAAK